MAAADDAGELANNDTAPLDFMEAVSELETVKAATTAAVLDIGSDPIHVNVLEGKTVDIRARALVDPKSTLKGVIDKEYLSLEDAGLQSGDMVWTVKVQKVGLTEFVIFGYGGHGEGGFRSVVFVQVHGLEG